MIRHAFKISLSPFYSLNIAFPDCTARTAVLNFYLAFPLTSGSDSLSLLELFFFSFSFFFSSGTYSNY
jgi:hypothetical protein